MIPAQTGTLRRKRWVISGYISSEPRDAGYGLGLWKRPVGVQTILDHQGALGQAAHLFLLQAQIFRQGGQLLLQYAGQHGPTLALLV